MAELEVSVVDLPEQELLILLQGEAVLGLEGNGAGRGDEPQMPDPVAAFVEVARLGMLARAATPPWLSRAALLDLRVDSERREQTWRIGLTHVDPGALKVLVNLLLARAPERASITSARIPEGAPPLLPAALPYPAPALPPPFPVDYQMPIRSSRERFLQLTFAHSPSDAALETVYAGLDAWALLPALGGYPADSMDPQQSAAIPDPAFLLDPCTVELAFPDMFLCDDDCYAAAVNWAHVLHRSVGPVSGLLLR